MNADYQDQSITSIILNCFSRHNQFYQLLKLQTGDQSIMSIIEICFQNQLTTEILLLLFQEHNQLYQLLKIQIDHQ